MTTPSDSVEPRSDSSKLPSASLWRRLIALIYDGFLLFAISLAYGGLVLFARIWLLGQDAATAPTSEIFQALQLGVWWFVLSLFYVWCWRRSGQTLGMKTWRLRLQQADGSAPTWKQCWLRCVLAPLSLASVIGYVWVLFSADGNCLHDRWTGTQVVVLPKSDSTP
ncbi:MAG: RDD family protein [Porticoccaceae bacterium]